MIGRFIGVSQSWLGIKITHGELKISPNPGLHFWPVTLDLWEPRYQYGLESPSDSSVQPSLRATAERSSKALPYHTFVISHHGLVRSSGIESSDLSHRFCVSGCWYSKSNAAEGAWDCPISAAGLHPISVWCLSPVWGPLSRSSLIWFAIESALSFLPNCKETESIFPVSAPLLSDS